MKNELLKIQENVFLKRPVLKEIFERFGSLSLNSYVKQGWEFSKESPDALFLDIFQNEFAELFGEELAVKARNQLAQKPLLSTVDHHGLWNHPIFVNSNVAYSLNFSPEELAIVLSTESVSLNNSCWAGSLNFHNEQLELCRESFFFDKEKMQTVFTMHPITEVNIKKLKEHSKGRFEGLINILDIQPDSSFSIQASKVNRKFWDLVFPSAPKMFYVPLETLVIKYLLKAFEDKQNLFTRLVLTVEGRNIWSKYFSEEHTFMFWGLDEKGRRVPLKGLPDNDAEIIELVQARKIYPSSPLCYSILLYAGLAAAGGFTQTTWLPEIKENFLKVLREFLVEDSILQKISKVPTKNFAESSLAWLKIGEGFVQPSAVDLYFAGKDYYPNYIKVSEKMTVADSINLAMPSIYSIVVPKAEQDHSLDLKSVEQWVFRDLEMHHHL